MKSRTQVNSVALHRIYQVLLVTSPLVTLGVNPWTSYDPISLPKMLVMTSFAFCLAFILISRNRDLRKNLPISIWVLFFIFFTWLSLSMLFSGAPIKQQFWGSFGRNTGFITYLSLLVILISAALLKSRTYYAGFTNALIGTAVPMTAYCLVQMAGRDPIGWSEFATFGTLGNVNFLSAFFGMTSIACLALIFQPSLDILKRVFLIILSTLDIYIAYSTGSIQGVVIFVAGIFALLIIFLLSLNSTKKPLYLLVYLVVFMSSVVGGVLGLMDKGPLARILYQPSVLFRADYIHAGWAMTVHKPLFGVGLDSYGDWYREARGEISTLRTGVDRISNSAHNIFLDVSSNGGIVLGLSFLSIILLAGISAIRYAITQQKFDPYFAAISSVWFAYVVQALISINQIGVGIWGWLFSGILIGYGQLAKSHSSSEGAVEQKVNLRKAFRGVPMSAKDSVAAITGFTLGLLVAAPPVNADIAFRSANLTGDISRISAAVSKVGSTQFHKEMALDFAMRNNLSSETGNLANKLVSEYPRSFFGWRVLSVLAASTPEERQKALLKVKSLDPYNPEIG